MQTRTVLGAPPSEQSCLDLFQWEAFRQHRSVRRAAIDALPTSVMNLRRASSGRDVRFIARPPHRTVRAAFPHTAPTSGV